MVMINSPIQPFFNKNTPFDEARYVFFGAPLDITSSYRSGSRFAPNAIRRASMYLESLNPRTGLDWEDLNIVDIGDLSLKDELEVSLEGIHYHMMEIIKKDKIPIMIGGEHTITYPSIKSIDPDVVIVLDAHMDLRDTLFDGKLNHATFLRRYIEGVEKRVVIIGARAYSREEIKFASSSENISIINSREIQEKGIEYAINLVREIIDEYHKTYLSIDMDVIDPGQAPAVGNPTPEGLSTTQILDFIHGSINEKIKGVDLTEVTPFYDTGLTAIQAAYIILNTLYAIEKGHKL
jgi:agmatinase